MNFASGRSASRKLTMIAGLAILASWAALWIASFSANRLFNGSSTYVPCYQFLGCDFDISYYASRTWLAGGNPYESYLNAGVAKEYDHPPPVLALFAWSNPLPRQTAMIAWFLAQTAIIGLGAYICCRNRAKLGLFPVPWLFALAAILFSYPVVFEMERGNWNSAVLLLIIVSVWSLRGRSFGRDLLTGTLIAAAAWIKMYPGLLILGLLALKRWRAAVICALAGLLIGLANVEAVLQFKKNIAASSFFRPDNFGDFVGCSHTVSGAWILFCHDIKLDVLARLPGSVGWGLMVFPLVLWVSYRVSQASNQSRLVYPYLVWLVAAATYLPTIANDYNLIFLPIAALAVWDRRDNWLSHCLMASLLFWWQPFALPVSNRVLWYSKLAGLGVVASMLVARAKEQAQAALGSTESPKSDVAAAPEVRSLAA